MDNNLSNVPVVAPEPVRITGVAPGHEKFAFLYEVIAAGALGSAITYGIVAGLSWPRTLLAVMGALTIGWAVLFSVLEVRRLAQTPEDRAKEALAGSSNPYLSRTVPVLPAAGDPCPHHEYYPESQGLDQGQLTSRLPGSTPLIDGILDRWTNRKQTAR